MLATPGERHEDCIPIGLFTYDGLRKYIKKETLKTIKEHQKSIGKEYHDSDGFEYYIFIMTPDKSNTWKYDCDYSIQFSIDDKEDDYEIQCDIDTLTYYLGNRKITFDDLMQKIDDELSS
jgi:hypothetical protein